MVVAPIPDEGRYSPLLALGGENSAVPMAAVVAGGALAALAATALMTGQTRSAT